MAKQTINIGTAPNDGTGDPLRTAFDKVNDNFTELYSDDAGDVNSIIEGAGISVDQSTGDVTISVADSGINLIKLQSVNTPLNDMVLTYDSATGGFEWRYDYVQSPDNTTIDLDTFGNLRVKPDGINHDELANRFTAKQDIITTSGTINLDASSYAIFELTSALTGATTLNIQNIKKGQVIDILVTGAQTITLADSFTTSTINQAGTGVYDGAASNHIQLTCVDDNDSDAILIYSVATYTSDTDPS